MENSVTKMGTKISLECDKDLKYYLEFFIGMELLKESIGKHLAREKFIRMFREYYKETNLPEYAKYQIVVALKKISKYEIEFHSNPIIAPGINYLLIKKIIL